MKRLKTILPIVISSYVLFITLWFSLWWLFGDGTWWLVVLNYFRLELFYPAPLILILALLSRRRSLIAASLLPFIFLLWMFWPYFIPRPALTDAPTQLRVMTFNVLFENEAYDAVSDVIKAYQPDIIALQEVQPEMMGALHKRLVEIYPYSQMSSENPYGTTAIFSRYPFLDVSVLDLGADRPAVVAQVQIGDQTVTFVSAHLLAYGLQWYAVDQIPTAIGVKTTAQNREVERILAAVREQTGPVIVACDCNSREHLSSSAILDSRMINTAREIGWRPGANVPAGTSADLHLRHIDYVFYRGDIQAAGIYKSHNDAGSDHAPVIADFWLPDGGD